jgi:hypothetical protein
MTTAWEICQPHLNPHIERMKHRAVQALQMLSPYEKQLLEDHLMEGVTPRAAWPGAESRPADHPQADQAGDR